MADPIQVHYGDVVGIKNNEGSAFLLVGGSSCSASVRWEG